MSNNTLLKNTDGPTTVIVDTSCFIKVQSDFLGIRNQDIIILNNLIKEKGIKLLSQEILDQEIVKHIDDSAILDNFLKITNNISQYESVLTLKDISHETINSISNFNLKNEIIQAFREMYSNAIYLGYPDPQVIFHKYFSCKKPFHETGKKKEEFPDAFVIQSIIEYVNQNESELVLVASNDNDWKEALEEHERIVLCDSIGKAIGIINCSNDFLSYEEINSIVNDLIDEIQQYIDYSVDNCYYNVPIDWEDVDINNVSIEKIDNDIIPIIVTNNKLINRLTVELSIHGYAREFDYNSSAWDSEDRDYIIKKYNNFSFKGKAYIEVDAYISYDKNNSNNNELTSAKINDGIIDVVIEDVTEY